MANVTYNSFKKTLGDGTVDWDTDVIKIALVTSTYVPDIDAHTNFTTHITNEVSGDGYTAGGEVLAGCAVTVDTVNDWAEYDATDVTWTTSTITARGAVIYASVTGDLIEYVDFVTDKSSSAGDFKITWHENGVFTIA